MIENAATSWLQRLAARGVTVTLRNNRIDIHPYIAFSELTDEELLFLRHNREAIKAAVRAGFTASAAVSSDEDHRSQTISEVGGVGPAPKTAASPTALCPYCNGPCVGKDRDIYRTLHALDPEEVERRQKEATAEMMQQIGKPSRW